MSQIPYAELEARLLEVVKADLKLQNVPLTPETPLNSDLGIDSLDFLMLVASVEKHFGVKIPNDQLGPATMKDVRTLATFVHGRLAA